MKRKKTQSDPAAINRLPVDMSTAIRGSLERARAFHERGDLEAAQHLYCGVLSLDRNNAEALHLLGLAYDQGGDPQRGEPLIARSLQLEQRYAWAYANHASVLIKLGHYDDALIALQKALRLDDRYAPALVARGNALLGLQRYQEAQAAYDQALTISPARAEA